MRGSGMCSIEIHFKGLSKESKTIMKNKHTNKKAFVRPRTNKRYLFEASENKLKNLFCECTSLVDGDRIPLPRGHTACPHLFDKLNSVLK